MAGYEVWLGEMLLAMGILILFGILNILGVNQFGAFLNWGLMKDLFVPFSEQKMKMQVGRSYVVHAHVDEESYRGNDNRDNNKESYCVP